MTSTDQYPYPGNPGPPPPHKAPPAHDGLAVTSFILSLLWLGGLGSLLAVIFGHRSRGESKRNGRDTSALATAGVVIGYVGLGGIVLLITLIVGVGVSSIPTTPATPAAVHTTTPAVTATPVVSTSEALVSWVHGSGGQALTGLGSAMSDFSSTPAGDLSAYGTACQSIASAVTSAQAAPPIPYAPAQAWYRRALAHYAQAGADCQAGVAAQSASVIEEATAQLGHGTTDLSRATAAINALENG